MRVRVWGVVGGGGVGCKETKSEGQEEREKPPSETTHDHNT